MGAVRCGSGPLLMASWWQLLCFKHAASFHPTNLTADLQAQLIQAESNEKALEVRAGAGAGAG